MTKSALALHYAHILHRNRPDFAWSDIVRHAWYFVRFRQWLSEGLVSFTYLKKDNSIRDARGTLCDLLIPREDLPKGSRGSTPNYAIVNYYDIDKKAWRSFDIRLFVGYVERYPLQKETSGPGRKYAPKGENVTCMQCGANKRRKKKGDKRKEAKEN